MADARRGVCVLGSINMDLVLRVPRFPGAGETIVGATFRRFPGGKGANQAVAAARALGGGALGASRPPAATSMVSMIGRVGSDDWGGELRALFAREGVDSSGVFEIEGVSTGVAVIEVAPSGENRIAVASGANALLSAQDVAQGERLVAGAAVLLSQLETPLEALREALVIARRAKATCVLNAAPASGLPSEETLDGILRALDVLVVNEIEARALSGTEGPPDELARALLECGPRAVVITLGASGAVRARGGEVVHQAPFPVRALDTTGAGDAFCGSLAAALAEGLDLAAAVRLGCAAGALAATREGAIPSLPGREEIEALLQAEVAPARSAPAPRAARGR